MMAFQRLVFKVRKRPKKQLSFSIVWSDKKAVVHLVH